MKRELGIARCGLACCLCAENDACNGCHAGECPGQTWYENRRCSIERGLTHCHACPEDCAKGLLGKLRTRAFNLFIQRHGEKALLDCLEANEQRGVVYHRSGFEGDYDGFDDIEALIRFIQTGER